MSYQVKSPVAIFIYNRAERAVRVLDIIRSVRPSRLLVVADGPKIDKPSDEMLCKAARDIVSKIDWPCEVQQEFAVTNMGCQTRISTGLDWVFQNVDEAIILEDDCVPCPTFFRFCDDLLERYRNEPRVMHIGGNNFQFGRERLDDASYYFSRYPHIWGWATWATSWKAFDAGMKDWPTRRDSEWLKDLMSDPVAVRYWRRIFDMTTQGYANSWAYQWTYTCWREYGFSITPDTNLVSNVGFGRDATHTKIRSKLADVPVHPMDFPLKHPECIDFDEASDDYTQENHFKATIGHRAFCVSVAVRRLFSSIPNAIFGKKLN